MLAIIISSFLLLFLALGFSLIVAKIISYTIVTDQFIIGLILVNGIASWVSIFRPLDAYVLLAFVAISFIAILFYRAGLIVFVSKLLKQDKLFYLFMLLFAIFTLLLTINIPDNYDTALYHLPSIKWIEEYKAIPGLANIHDRLGFNSNIFLLFSLSSLKFFFGQEIFSVNYTLYLIVSAYFIYQIITIFNRKGCTNLFFFNLLSFINILRIINLNNPSPDYFSTIIPIYVFSRFINASDTYTFDDVFILFIVSLFTITVKFAQIPILFLFLILFFKFRKDFFKNSGYLIVLSLFLLIPWIIRNIILTGWLLFPFHYADFFHFDWKVPAFQVINTENGIKYFAQYREYHPHLLPYGKWLLYWWKLQNKVAKSFVLLGILSPCLVCIFYRFNRIKLNFIQKLVFVTSFLGVLFWFILAPNIRFGIPFLTISAMAFPVAVHFRVKLKQNRSFLFALFMLLFVYIIYLNRQYKEQFKVTNLYRLNKFILPEKIKIPADVHFKQFRLQNITINYPEINDQTFDFQLPSAPGYDSTLRLRGNSIQEGFKVVSNLK